jgi:hypothetical protein
MWSGAAIPIAGDQSHGGPDAAPVAWIAAQPYPTAGRANWTLNAVIVPRLPQPIKKPKALLKALGWIRIFRPMAFSDQFLSQADALILLRRRRV